MYEIWTQKERKIEKGLSNNKKREILHISRDTVVKYFLFGEYSS